MEAEIKHLRDMADAAEAIIYVMRKHHQTHAMAMKTELSSKTAGGVVLLCQQKPSMVYASTKPKIAPCNRGAGTIALCD